MYEVRPECFQLIDRACEALHGCSIDERTHQRPRIERVADSHAAVGTRKSREELLPDPRVDDQPSRGRATLARRADGAEEYRAHSQIGGLVDHDRTVAGTLEQVLAHAPRNRLPQFMGRAARMK